MSVPIEWLGNCWHQSVMRWVAAPLAIPVVVFIGIRSSRPVTTQPSVVGPGPGGMEPGLGQTSDQRAALPPGSASYVYRT